MTLSNTSYRLAAPSLAIMLFLQTAALAHDSLNVSRIGQSNLNPLENQIALAGDFAYVASGGSGLQIVNISTPAIPVNVNAIWGDIAVCVAAANQHVYVGYFGNSMDGMRIYNIANPANPDEVFNYQDGAIYSIAIVGNLAYIGAHWGSELQILNISNPASPVLVGSYELPNGAQAKDIALSGNNAYLAATESGLVVIDVSNPSSPQLIGSFDTPDYSFSVTVSGTTAFLADLSQSMTSSAIRAINISNPASPQLLGSFPANATGLEVSGNYAYASDIKEGVRVLNVANPVSMTEVGYYEAPGAMAIQMQGQTAFTSVYPWFDVYDCSAAASQIERVGDVIPQEFAIKSSFPNPFNSSTIIRYQIARASNVELKVYDVTGKEVKTLVDFHQNPGTYQVQFDASEFASGTYFAQLTAGEFKQTHKMVLLK
ncbi:MAG: T9SS type A sorting domain-containing protein [bacterium]|nr:T9SS type A sorting domain-containing protein [bacterium]